MNKLFRALTSVLMATHFAADASATPQTIELPGETAKLKESTLPGYAVATQKCLICHSVDYISFQPPGMTQKQWTAEMLKMQHLYGAPRRQDSTRDNVGYEAAHWKCRDGPGLCSRGTGRDALAIVVGHPVSGRHECRVVSVECMIDDLDFRQVLDPIRAEITGHNQFQGKPIQKRNVLAVHAPGQQRSIAQRMIDVQGFAEIRRARQYGRVQAIEGHLPGHGYDTSFLENLA